MSDSLTPRTVAFQVPLSVEFSRREYWSRLPFPSPGDLPRPGIKPMSPALAGGFFATEPPGKTILRSYRSVKERNVGSNLHKRALSSTKPALKGGLWKIDPRCAEDQ